MERRPAVQALEAVNASVLALVETHWCGRFLLNTYQSILRMP